MKSERELRLLIGQSQEDGFRAVFTQYSRYVSTIVWNRIRGVGTQEDAEEAVSDVFADLFRNFALVEEGKLESYIRTLAKRTAVDTFRRLTARQDSPAEREEVWNDVISDDDVEQNHERSELRHALIECIWSLGEPDATILIWKYFYDCSAEEIGKKVGLNRLAVRKRLSRARVKLRELLAGRGITP